MDHAPREVGDDCERLAAQGERLRMLLMHLASRAVRSRFELEDLLQEIYLRAVTAPSGLPPAVPGDGELWRFLVVLARHTVIDAARSIRAGKRAGTPLSLDATRSGRRPSAHEGRLASAILAKSAGPSTRAAAAESARALAAAFDALPAEHRRVIGLRRFEALPARAAAERMGRSETAVHSLYRRALETWEENLRRAGVLGGESDAGRRSGPP
jgi:RNA polymerase sigma factor (sigma-70 family)